MPIPGTQTSQSGQSANQARPRIGLQKSHYEIAPAGMQDAVLVEVNFDWIPNKFEGGKPDYKMVWTFELAATREDGHRFIVPLELFPSISAGNKVGKLCQSWSGSAKKLTDEQIEEWIVAFMGNTNFDTGEIDENPPILGANCQLKIVHNTSKTTGNDYAAIQDILPPSTERQAKPLSKSDGYTPYAKRKAAAIEREQQKGGHSAQPQQQDAPTGGEKHRVPF